MKVKNILLALAVLAPFAGQSQQKCKGIQFECLDIKKDEPKNKADKKGAAWTVTGQSRYGNFAYGDTTEVTITVYKGVNYRISFCALDPAVQGKITYQIVERKTTPQSEEYFVTEEVPKTNADGEIMYDDQGNPINETKTIKKVRRIYGKTPVVRYDNTKDSNKQWVEFTTDQDRSLIVKVVIPASGEAAKNDLSPQGYACVGMLIEQQMGPQSGGWK